MNSGCGIYPIFLLCLLLSIRNLGLALNWTVASGYDDTNLVLRMLRQDCEFKVSLSFKVLGHPFL